MNDNVYTVTYFSQANLSGSISDVKDEVKKILDVAQRKNKEKGITGALLYSGGYFIQVLEGDEHNVEDIFESIQCDHRHNNVTVLTNRYLARRSFANWSMALVGVHKDILPEIKAILPDVNQIHTSNSDTTLIESLAQLLKKYESVNVEDLV